MHSPDCRLLCHELIIPFGVRQCIAAFQNASRLKKPLECELVKVPGR